MQRILSTYLYIEHKLTPAMLTDIERAGFNGVQIFCSGYHFNYRENEIVREIADWFKDHKLKLDSLHGPTSRDFGSGTRKRILAFHLRFRKNCAGWTL